MNQSSNPSKPILIERVPARTARQGTAKLVWPKNGAVGSVASLVDVGKWDSSDPLQARPVRVTFFPTQVAAIGPFNPAGASAGAMGLVTYTGQNGTEIKRWVACPADLELVACSVRVQACAVGLPYQAFPGNCRQNTSSVAQQFNVAVTFADGKAGNFPTLPLYPAAFVTSAGASSAMGAGNAKQPLIYAFSGGMVQGAPGFLRALKVTNASASTVYAVAMDLAPNDASASGTSFVAFSAFAPFAVPAGVTVVESFDDLPFVFGPYVGLMSSLTTPAFADGAALFVEASYAPIATPGY